MACNRCNLKRIMALFKKQDEARKRAAKVAQEKPEVIEEPKIEEVPVEAALEAAEVPVVETLVEEVKEEVVVEIPIEEAPVEALAPAPRRRRTRKTAEEAPAQEASSGEEKAAPAPEEEATPMEVETVTEDTIE